MRVNISYSVELEETPKAVANIIQQACEDLKKTEFNMENLGKKLKNDPDISKSLLKMDSLRKDLFKIDNILLDSISILAGYQKATSEKLLPPPEIKKEKEE